MPFNTIISAKELSEHIHDPNWIIVDCRFDLMDPDWGEEEYRSLHIPGAVYANMNTDLSSPVTPTSGRHPLPETDNLIKTLQQLGISRSSQVIAYDSTSGSFAARLWFLLRYLGHINVAILDGGLPAWLTSGLETNSGWQENPAGDFVGKPNLEMVISTREMETIIQDPSWLIIDSRAHERYIGATETIDAKAGHIPTAVNYFYGLNSNPDGTFRSAQELRKNFKSLLGNQPVEKTVIYCGSGVTSAHNLLAMVMAGYTQPKLYNGSWSEWIRDPKHAIVTGE